MGRVSGGDDVILGCDTIGETIRKLRHRHGMSQDELAAASGISAGAIHSLEAGKRKGGGRLDTTLGLLDALGMECVIRPTTRRESRESD
jgi:transcriptional regulator with XRE-family HTH domain